MRAVAFGMTATMCAPNFGCRSRPSASETVVDSTRCIPARRWHCATSLLTRKPKEGPMSQSTTFICDRCGQKETDLVIVGRDWRVICRPRLRSDSGVVTLDLCQDCAAFFDVWMKEKRDKREEEHMSDASLKTE